jgi:hypothetical protein
MRSDDFERPYMTPETMVKRKKTLWKVGKFSKTSYCDFGPVLNILLLVGSLQPLPEAKLDFNTKLRTAN